MGLTLASGVAPGSMLLDIDDWEVGFRLGHPGSLLHRAWRRAQDAAELVAPRRLNSYASEVALDRAARRFPHVLVSNQWLANRFGGRLLPHVRDTSFLDPARVDVEAARHDLGMSGRPWVGFIGTVRQHKGVEVLLDALDRVGGDAAPGLYVAGADDHDEFVRSFVERAKRRLGEDRVRIVGQFDFELLPRRVAVADVICIPSLDDPAAWGQIPAKLFDAMAMAKPVIASRVNDLEAVLDGCGRVVTPGDPAALAARIEELCASATLRQELGARARQRAIERYSHTAGRQTLRAALSEVQPFAPRASAG